MTKLEAELQKKIVSLQTQREEIDRQLFVYEAALENEQRQNGVGSSKANAHRSASGRTPNPPLEAADTDLKADTGFVRNFVYRKRSTGVDAAEIKDAAIRRGLTIHEKKFPYVILWKLKKQGDIVLEDGLYFPASQN